VQGADPSARGAGSGLGEAGWPPESHACGGGGAPASHIRNSTPLERIPAPPAPERLGIISALAREMERRQQTQATAAHGAGNVGGREAHSSTACCARAWGPQPRRWDMRTDSTLHTRPPRANHSTLLKFRYLIKTRVLEKKIV
jgi:hypothetical protein